MRGQYQRFGLFSQLFNISWLQINGHRPHATTYEPSIVREVIKKFDNYIMHGSVYKMKGQLSLANLEDLGLLVDMQRLFWNQEASLGVRRNSIDKMILLALHVDNYLRVRHAIRHKEGLTQTEILYVLDSYPPKRRKTNINPETKCAMELKEVDPVKEAIEGAMRPLKFTAPVSPQQLNQVLRRMVKNGEVEKKRAASRCERSRYQVRMEAETRPFAIHHMMKKIKKARNDQFFNEAGVLLLFPDQWLNDLAPMNRLQRDAEESRRTKACTNLTHEIRVECEKAIAIILENHKMDLEKAARYIEKRSQRQRDMDVDMGRVTLDLPTPPPLILIDLENYFGHRIVAILSEIQRFG